jgi:hypothetical protein
MIKWLADLLFIGVAAFVGSSICIGVERGQLARMVLIVAVMMAMLLTIQDVSPTLAKWGARIDSIQKTLERIP